MSTVPDWGDMLTGFGVNPDFDKVRQTAVDPEFSTDRRMAVKTTEARNRIALDELVDLSKLGNDQLLRMIVARHVKGFSEERVKNNELFAGAPMFFYCALCGANHAILPETYLEQPPKLCRFCIEAEDRGLIGGEL